MDHAHRGEAALSAGNLEEAITFYTEAIRQSPSSPTYYIKRSTAYQRTSQTNEALRDAEQAVILATKRAKRELIAQAQLRRAIASYQLGQYGDARYLLGVAKKLDPQEKTIGIWDAKNTSKLKEFTSNDKAAEVTVKEMPDEPTTSQPEVVSRTPTSVTSASKESTPAATPAPASSASTTSKEKIRHDWYQSTDSVYITILAKNVPKDHPSTAINIQTRSVSVSFPVSSESQYDFSLKPLFSDVDVEQSSFRILSTKIEIILRKSVTGAKWPQLEANLDETLPLSSTMATEKGAARPTAGPSYPTSSKKGPKDWDAIVKEHTRKPGSDSKDSEDDSAQVDEYLDEGDETTAFFRKLYAGADPDTRRAMMKSFQESGGTALSTNWGEVGQGRVPVSPPEGMEEKKW